MSYMVLLACTGACTVAFMLGEGLIGEEELAIEVSKQIVSSAPGEDGEDDGLWCKLSICAFKSDDNIHY